MVELSKREIEAWDYVTKTYFPRWNKRPKIFEQIDKLCTSGEFPLLDADLEHKYNEWTPWKLRKEDMPGSWAYAGCNSHTKTIALYAAADDAVDFRHLVWIFIHEICHAVAGDSHLSKKWQRRMDQAADQAAEIGDFKLAEIITADRLSYIEYPEEADTFYNYFKKGLFSKTTGRRLSNETFRRTKR
jgi:hypothetical protein